MAELPSRINQNGERLQTVRPRYRLADESRGTAASLRFHVPNEEWATFHSNASQTQQQYQSNALWDVLNPDGLGYINFIAQNIDYGIVEKQQIVHTFGGKEAVYFYGHAPIVVNLSGIIVDDLDNDQFAQFLSLYKEFLRGSKAAQEYSYVEMSINNAQFTGAFLSIQIQQGADRDTDVRFTASFLAREFMIRSTDEYFLNADGSGDINYTTLTTRDPTITASDIFARTANNTASLVPLPDDSPTASVTAGLSTGNYTKSIITLPTIKDLIGFSASDVTDFFGDINDFISNFTAPLTDLAAQVAAFANEAVSYVDAIESGIDDIIGNIESATRSVYGAANNIDNAITKICNFPDSLSAKVGSIGEGGGARVEVAGGPDVDAGPAMLSLSAGGTKGAARGTPTGEAAVLIVNQRATLSLGITPPSEDPVLDPSLPIKMGG